MKDLEAKVQASNLSEPDKIAILKLLTLTRKSSRDMTGAELRAAREAAGLRVSQSANFIAGEFNVDASAARVHLIGWENDEDKPSTQISLFLDRIYGLNRDGAANAPKES